MQPPTLQDYVNLGFTGDNITQAVTWGFGTVVVLWLSGYGIAIGLGIIKRV